MNKKYVLISIKPVFAQKIKSGEKTIELRKIAPKIQTGDIFVIYESSPIQAITAYCEVKRMIELPPKQLWQTTKKCVGISRSVFDAYFKGRTIGYGIELMNISVLEIPVPLKSIRQDLTAPQSYRYITETDFLIMRSGERLSIKQN